MEREPITQRIQDKKKSHFIPAPIIIGGVAALAGGAVVAGCFYAKRDLKHYFNEEYDKIHPARLAELDAMRDENLAKKIAKESKGK